MSKRVIAGVAGVVAALSASALVTAGFGSVGGLSASAQTVAGHEKAAGPSTAPGGVLSAANDLKTSGHITLDGAGANSIDPFYQVAFYDYHQANGRVTINYSPAGSSVGVKDTQQGTVDFGDSEIPMSSSALAKSKGTVLQLPVDLGGVAISYNIPGVRTGLKLNGPILARIFSGTLTNWDSPVIAQETGVKNLPNLQIVAVHRADSSGPAWDLDRYLIQTAPGWVAAINSSTASTTWPLPAIGVGQQLNSGVATYIKQTPGAIGYVEYGYALEAGFTNAALENEAGDYVAPSEKSIAAAGKYAAALSPSRYTLIDMPGAGTYPLANFSWALLYQRQTDEAKGIVLGKVFDYVVTTGQSEAAKLGYAPMPANAVKLATSTLEKLDNSSGQALFSS